ncbi:MAG: hypothetical protein LBV26_04915 [Bacteroidales bacterium]|nr:hypothetical protein [Bacteroidales bacterium]
MLSALILSVAFSATLHAGGGGGKGGSLPPAPPPVTTQNTAVVLDFYTPELSGIVAYCGIPQNMQYMSSNSSATLNYFDWSNYYCEVYVHTSDGSYSKTSPWVAGGQMNVPLPTNRAYTVEISYYEPASSSCYSWGGQGRIFYYFSGSYSSYSGFITAVMKYQTIKTN